MALIRPHQLRNAKAAQRARRSHSKAADFIIDGSVNCSSQIEYFGEKQIKYTLGASMNVLDIPNSLPGRLSATSECPTRNCFALVNARRRLVFQDLASSDFGVMVESKPVLADGRTKVTMFDPEGRTITFLITDPTDVPFNPNVHLQLFDVRDHGYFCIDPKKPGLDIIESQGRKIINCFSSLRYSILQETGASANTFSTGSVPFVGVGGGPANSNLVAPSDRRYFGSGLIAESLQFD